MFNGTDLANKQFKWKTWLALGILVQLSKLNVCFMLTHKNNYMQSFQFNEFLSAVKEQITCLHSGKDCNTTSTEYWQNNNWCEMYHDYNLTTTKKTSTYSYRRQQPKLHHLFKNFLDVFYHNWESNKINQKISLHGVLLIKFSSNGYKSI